MLICHKLVVSNAAAVQQACHMSDVHATSAVCQRRDRLCDDERLIQYYPSRLVSQTPSLDRDASPPPRCETQLSYP